MRKFILVALISLVSVAVWAADKVQPLNVKLGLWEVTTATTSSGQMPIPADMLARLTPEQRAKLEERMKANSAAVPKPISHKNCLTKEKVESGYAFGDDKQTCTRKVLSSNSSKLEMQLVCDIQGLKNESTFLVEVVSNESVKGTAHGTTAGNNKTLTSDATFTAKWLGSTCGDVK